MVASYAASISYEDIAKSSPHGVQWMQLCIPKDREWFHHLVKTSDSHGYQALIITLDDGYSFVVATGMEDGDRRQRFRGAEEVGIPNLAPYLERHRHLPHGADLRKFYSAHAASFTSFNWKETIHWLRSITKLRILLKGIMSLEDALMTHELKVDGIIVSNHGGRIINGVPATVRSFLFCS